MNSTSASEIADAPRRMVLICTTLGLHAPSLFPTTPGSDHEQTEYLEILKDHANDFTLFSGLSHKDQNGRQPHSCEVTWLTAAANPGLDGFRNTVSVDQVAAEHVGNATRFPSLVLSTDRTMSQSFTRSGVMIPAEDRPSRLFTRMFLQGAPDEVERQKQSLNDGRSILDELLDQTRALQQSASATDRQRLDEYFESIRIAERDLAVARQWLDTPKPAMDAEQPTDIPERSDLIGRTRLMMNMIPLIVQSDSSRVISLVIQDHQVVPQVDGVLLEHHNLSHHGQDETKIEQLKRIETELTGCFSGLLGQLKETREAGSPLLDNTTVLFGSNLGNANAHDPRNLPIFLAGGGFEHGRYVAHDKENNTPLCNLFCHDAQQHGNGGRVVRSKQRFARLVAHRVTQVSEVNRISPRRPVRRRA